MACCGERARPPRHRQLEARLGIGLAVLAVCACAVESTPIHLFQLDFCDAAAWSKACELAAHYQQRRDLYCSTRLAPLQRAILGYCVRHKAALSDIAQHGREAAKKYKYVAAVYELAAGLWATACQAWCRASSWRS